MQARADRVLEWPMEAPSLRLLARPDLGVDGSRKLLEPGQVSQFLAVLGYRSEWVRRDELIGLFWPEGSDAAGRRNLRRLLFRARERLGRGGDANVPEIEGDGDALRWVLPTDVHAWREALGRADFEDAYRYWRGPLCDRIDPRGDVGFGAWLAVERERLAAAWKDALLPYAAHIAQVRPGEAAALLARLVAIDPLDEEVVQGQLGILMRAGRAAETERVYRAFAEHLDSELGLEPSPATTAIVAGVTERSAAPAVRDGALRHRLRSQSLSFPLTGRDELLAELGARLEMARRGSGGVVAIEGEAGAGKTRLADEFLAVAEADGVKVLRGRSFERELGAPLEPVRAALAGLAAAVGSEPDVPASAWPPDRPALADVHQALTGHVVQAARAGGAAILFVDDVQWADAATLEFLAYAAKRAIVEPVLILVGQRREDRAKLESWLADLAQHRVLHTLRVERLERAELQSLLAAGGELPQGDLVWLAQHLHEQTEGNPFYATEYLRWLAVQGGVRLDAGGSIAGIDCARIEGADLPESVLSLIRSRYLGFPKPTRDLLDLAAVLGRAFELAVLEAAVGRSGRAFWSAFAPLMTAGLMVDAAGGEYAFSHDKLRQSIYQGLGPPVRKALHAQVAVTLAERGADPSELAHHHLRAEDWSEAFAQLMGAGERAERRDGWRVALQAFGRAEEVAARLPDSARRELEALERRERILELMDRRSDRADAVERMILLARELGNASAEAHAHLRKMGLRALAGDREGVRLARKRATRLLEQLGDPLAEARVYRELAYAAFSRGDDRAVVDAGLGAIRVYRATGDARNEAATAWNVAMAYRRMDRVAEALSWGDRAADIYDGMGEGTGDYMRHEMKAWAMRRAGELEAACALLATTLSLAEELGEPHLVLEKHMNLASALLDVGRPRNALEHFVAGAAIGVQLGDPRHEGYPMLQIGAVRQRLGDLEGAIEAFRQAARLLESAYAVTGVDEERLSQADALTLLGSALGAEGAEGVDGGEAREALDRALEIATDASDPFRASKVLMERGVHHWRADRFDDAASDFDAAASAARKVGAVSREIAAHASRLVALADGARPVDAIAAGERALEQLCAFPEPAAEAHVCRALARAWDAYGDAVRARALRMRAARLRRGHQDPRPSETPYRSPVGGSPPPER